MKRYKTSFIGVGKLGQSCAEMVAEKHDVVGYDIFPKTPKNFNMVKTLEEATIDRDIIFIAVETPHDPLYDGKAPTSHLPNKNFDYSTVKQVLCEINKLITRNQIVVLISTVLPGTVRKELKPLIPEARLIYNPYLIAMGTVKWDMVNPEMIIIGTEDGGKTGDAKELVEFYKSMMQNEPPYHVGTWEECECLKVFYNCYSDDTEVLTSSGWKLFKDAIDTDQVFSLDPNTMLPEWITPNKWVSRDYDGSMIHFRGRNDDVLVTPGHNMFVDSKSGDNCEHEWELVPAHDVIKRKGFVFQKSIEWHNDSPSTITVDGLTFKTEDYVQFMAWFLSEGYICKQTGRIIVFQDLDKNPDKYEMFIEVFYNMYDLKKIDTFRDRKTGRTGIAVSWPKLLTYLKQFGNLFVEYVHRPYVPNEIKTLGKDMIRLFLDTYNLESCETETTGKDRCYTSTSDQMAADLGELIIKVGRFPSYRTTIDNCHLIYELVNMRSLYRNCSSVGLKVNSIDYDGKVYCAVLPKNHVFLTRRNGKCTWQGNTFISAKVSLVNMIQDVAEKQGNINSEWVCDALAKSDRRIMGPAYMKPGMGDGGACVLPSFPIEVNSVKTTIENLYDSFDNTKDQTFLVKSANHAMSKSDQKKVFKANTRDYDGNILVFHTKSGKILECTPEHLIPIQREGKQILVCADEITEQDKLFSV